MGSKVREEFSTLLAALNHNAQHVDLSRVLSVENSFDATLIRGFLIEAFQDDDFDTDMIALSDEFVRGVLSGLCLCLSVERKHGEKMGRSSHAEMVHLYDSGMAYLTEKAL